MGKAREGGCGEGGRDAEYEAWDIHREKLASWKKPKLRLGQLGLNTKDSSGKRNPNTRCRSGGILDFNAVC